MKKKYVILIIVGLVLVIGGYFGYKSYYYFKYIPDALETRDKYINELKIDGKITVKTKILNSDEYFQVNNIKIRNDFKDFELSDKFVNDDNGKSYILKENGIDKEPKTVISLGKNIINATQALNESADERAKELIKEKNIKNDLDLLLHIIENKNKKPNIFSSKHEIEFYAYEYITLMLYNIPEKITLIDGDLTGFIFEPKNTSAKDIYLFNGTDKYTITLWNKEYFTDDYVKELLNTIIIGEEKEKNEDCCKGCICGDTIELLKNTETAWTLTKINSEGEYEPINDAFINFHGTGKNKFAFFENVKEIKGEFSINKRNEIILIPNDNKNNKIICKLGEEKDLIAVMNCDNNFGTFIIQKQGILELPNVIKDTVSKTKAITVKGKNSKTITEEKEIDVLLSVINNSKVWTGATTLPSPLYELELFDASNNSIAKIVYNPGHYFDIEINNKSYNLTNIDKNSLNTILEK